MQPFLQKAAIGTLFALCLVVFLTMLGEEVACAAVSPNLYIMSYIKVQCYLPLRQLHSDFGDFNNGVYHVMKITSRASKKKKKEYKPWK